jgi:hypothetical protein
MGFEKIILGEGKLYLNYGEVSQADLGYVRGGEFNENITFRHIEVDGKKGNVAGDAVVETVQPQLDVVMMEIVAANMAKVFSGVDVDATTPASTKLTRSLKISASDYLLNVAYVGQTKQGKNVIVKVLNATGEGPINLVFADKAEVEIPVSFMGNYTALTDTKAPYEIIIDESV